MMNKIGIYVHIPFCKSKCGYCDFYSRCDLSKAERYVDALLLQFDAWKQLLADRSIDSVYIGGGTPTVIGDILLLRVIRGIFDRFCIESGAEFTIEANPGTVDQNSLDAYRKAGVNRISFGVQSANDALLCRIGRIHNYNQARQAILWAKEAGFDNLSADLMYALPDQSKEDLLLSIERLSDLPLSHISMYGLKVEENTPFGRDPDLVLPDEEEQCAMYLEGVEMLAQRGFTQYEISNFAKEGKVSRHNLRYWKREEYIGFGCAAHSFYKGRRFFVPRSLEQFLNASEYAFPSVLYTVEELSLKDVREEQILLPLRTAYGVSKKELLLLVGEEKRSMVEGYLSSLERGGYAAMRDENLFLTPRGMLLSNTIISDLLCYLDE